MEEYLTQMAMAYILSKSARAEDYPYASIDFTDGVHIANAKECALALGKTTYTENHSEEKDLIGFRFMGVKFFSLYDKGENNEH